MASSQARPSWLRLAVRQRSSTKPGRRDPRVTQVPGDREDLWRTLRCPGILVRTSSTSRRPPLTTWNRWPGRRPRRSGDRDKRTRSTAAQLFAVMRASRDPLPFFYIGGQSDSADTCRIVDEQARENDYQLRIVTCRKTIDNDLVGTDHCPGYGSRRSSVAQASRERTLDNACLPGVYIAVVMGRHAGFLTGGVGVREEVPGRRAAPHLPARAAVFDPERFVQGRRRRLRETRALRGRRLRGGVRGRRRLIVRRWPGERRARRARERAAFRRCAGRPARELIKEKTRIRRVRPTRWATCNGRTSAASARRDAHEARESARRRFSSPSGRRRRSVAIKRVGDYAVEYELLKLAEVAGRTK